MENYVILKQNSNKVVDLY